MNDWIKSYSHSAEDILLARVLKDVEQGFYIDVGAFDPVEESITKIFYDAGWAGINLEPNPDKFLKLQEYRPRDRNLDVAVSDVVGELELSLIPDTGLTTLVGDIAESHAKAGFDVKKITVSTQTLVDLWEAHVPEGQDVHFLKIDVEGAEEAVIRGADWTRHRPWVLMVEAVMPLSTAQNHDSWDSLLLEADYLFAYFDGLNRYYVAKEKSSLQAGFTPPLNVATDRFVPYGTSLALDKMHRVNDAYVSLGEAYDGLVLRHDLLTAQHAELTAQHRNLAGQLSNTQADLAIKEGLLQRRPRPLWEQLVFRSAGQPKRLFRRILFHTSGKPRGIFRSWILRADGLPHTVFYKWMSGPNYRALPKAVQVHQPSQSPVSVISPISMEEQIEANQPTVLSRDADHMKRRLLKAMSEQEEKSES